MSDGDVASRHGILAAARALALPLSGCGLVLGIEELSAEQGAGWSLRLGEAGAQAGSTSDDRATRVAVGPDGEVALAGTAGGEVIFDDSVAFGGALFVAMLGDDGSPAWMQRFGAAGDHLAGIAVGPAGNVVLAGHLSGTLDLDDPLTSTGAEEIDLGPDPLQSRSSDDLFVAKIAAPEQ